MPNTLPKIANCGGDRDSPVASAAPLYPQAAASFAEPSGCHDRPARSGVRIPLAPPFFACLFDEMCQTIGTGSWPDLGKRSASHCCVACRRLGGSLSCWDPLQAHGAAYSHASGFSLPAFLFEPQLAGRAERWENGPERDHGPERVPLLPGAYCGPTVCCGHSPVEDAWPLVVGG